MSALIAAEPLRAGVEDLLPLLLFVVIWWVSSRRERKKRLAEEGTPPPRAVDRPGQPLPTRDEEGVDPLELIQRMLFGGMELPPLPVEPPPIPTDQDAAGRTSERRAESPPLSAPPRPRKVREPPRPPAKPGTAVQPRAAGKPRPLARASRQELQQAIVWSEILAPPVALRDEP